MVRVPYRGVPKSEPKEEPKAPEPPIRRAPVDGEARPPEPPIRRAERVEGGSNG